LLMYKGPDAQNEILEAQRDLKSAKWSMRVVFEYELPDSLGSRSVIEITR
jgi:hypothetical protein